MIQQVPPTPFEAPFKEQKIDVKQSLTLPSFGHVANTSIASIAHMHITDQGVKEGATLTAFTTGAKQHNLLCMHQANTLPYWSE